MQAAAESLAAEYKVTYIGVTGRTRSPGRMIVDAAIEHEASVIVVGAPSKPRRGRTMQEEFFGRTVDFILRKAPCRVIVTHFPGSALDLPEDAVATAPG